MTFYGNKTWNDSIDNNDKSFFIIDKNNFDEIVKILDTHALNYYAFSKDDTVKMAINTQDTKYIDTLFSSLSVDEVTTGKSNNPKDIICTVEYDCIQDKRYFTSDKDSILKVAELLQKENIPYYARLYENRATIAVTLEDDPKLHRLYNQVIRQRLRHNHVISKSLVYGSVPSNEIKNKTHFFSSETNKDDFLKIKPEIDKTGFKYAAFIKNEQTVLVVEKENYQDFKNVLNLLTNKEPIINNFKKEGFSAHQISLIENIINIFAEKAIDIFMPDFFETSYKDEHIINIGTQLEKYANQSEDERVFDKNGILQNIIGLKKEYEMEINFEKSMINTNFSEEQKNSLFQGMKSGINMDSILQSIDESFSVDEIDTLVKCVGENDFDGITKILQEHDNKMIMQYVNEPGIQETFEIEHNEPKEKTIVNIEDKYAEEPANKFEIYRLNKDNKRLYRFELFENLKIMNFQVVPQNYECIYKGVLEDGTTPEKIYEKFNISHPDDFKDYSLSVGDIIAITKDGDKKALFIDSFGFKELNEFFKENEILKDDSNLFDLKYSDKNKGIIGNTPFRFISQKQYNNLDTDIAMKISKILVEKDIKFSCKIGTDISTITISSESLNDYKEVEKEVKEQNNIIDIDKKKVDIDEMIKRIDEGVSDVFQSDKYKEYLKFASNFTDYSARNTMLICLQKPESTLVASFGKWRKLGRNIKEGEKGISILAPITYKTNQIIEVDKPVKDEKGNSVYNPDGSEKKETIEKPLTGISFKPVYVFDVSQTTGKELPSMVDELKGDINPELKKALFDGLKKVSGIEIEFQDIKNGAKGFYNSTNNQIVIKSGMSDAQTLKTAFHEVAHCLLHDPNKEIDTTKSPRNEKEVQAELVAFIVAERFGIDTSEYSFPYIASWSAGKQLEQLKNVLQEIQSTAKLICSEIEKELLEPQKSVDEINVKSDDKSQTKKEPVKKEAFSFSNKKRKEMSVELASAPKKELKQNKNKDLSI